MSNPETRSTLMITAWTRKRCHKCGRERAHYRLKNHVDWKCIGTLSRITGARCGDKVMGGVGASSQ